MPDENLKQEYERARAYVGTSFYSARADWAKLLERNAPNAAPDDAADDYQTPELEHALETWIDGLVGNPTLFDVVLTSKDTEEARKARDNIRLWASSMWKHRLNVDRWWDQAVAERQVRDGIAIMRLGWKEVIEPGEGLSDEERDRMLKRQGSRFYFEDIPLEGTAWTEEGRDADVFFYEAEIPVIEGQQKFKKQGESSMLSPVVDAHGHLGWVGEHDATQERRSDTDAKTPSRKLKVLYRDARDPQGRRCPLEGCDHPMRVISVYLYGDGQDRGQAELYEEQLSPFPGCSFFIIPARRHNSRNMHLRYRPPLHPMYVEAAEINYTTTLLTTMSRKDYEGRGLFIDGSKINPDVRIGEAGVQESYPYPGDNNDKLVVYPGPLETMPSKVSPHLAELRRDSQERMAKYMPNRYLTGEAHEEATDATGSAFIQQAAAANKPLNRVLSASDGYGIYKGFMYIFHAIRYFDCSGEKTTEHKYYATTMGDEDVMTGGSEAGRDVAMTKSLLESIDFELQIKTESETLAEQNARYLLWSAMYDKGIATVDDVMKAAGIRDVERQKRLLYKQRLRQIDQPQREQAQLMIINRIRQSLTGLDLGTNPAAPAPPVSEERAPPGIPGADGRFSRVTDALVPGPTGGNYAS